MKSKLNNIEISGVYGVIPKNVSYYDDEIENYSHSIDSSLKLKKVMGYNQHRVVATDAALTDLIVPAFERMVQKGLIEPADIDAVVLVTQTPNFSIPSTSSILHGKLGLKTDCYCIDINDGCTGYLRGLFEASSIVRNSDAKQILLITGDVLSRKVSVNDRNSYPLVGDAVTLTLINAAEQSYESPFELLADGTGALALNVPAGGMVLPSDESTAKLVEDEEGNFRSLDNLVMKGRDVFVFTQTTVLKFISDFVKLHKDAQLSSYFLHQANLFILDRIAKKLKVSSEQLPTDVITKYGNSSAATIPMAMVEKYRHSDDVSSISERALLAGFGVGLSWGAAIININNLQFCELIELEV